MIYHDKLNNGPSMAKARAWRKPEYGESPNYVHTFTHANLYRTNHPTAPLLLAHSLEYFSSRSVIPTEGQA